MLWNSLFPTNVTNVSPHMRAYRMNVPIFEASVTPVRAVTLRTPTEPMIADTTTSIQTPMCGVACVP